MIITQEMVDLMKSIQKDDEHGVLYHNLLLAKIGTRMLERTVSDHYNQTEMVELSDASFEIVRLLGELDLKIDDCDFRAFEFFLIPEDERIKVVVSEAYDKKEWMIGKIGYFAGTFNRSPRILIPKNDQYHVIYGNECWWAKYEGDREAGEDCTEEDMDSYQEELEKSKMRMRAMMEMANSVKDKTTEEESQQ